MDKNTTQDLDINETTIIGSDSGIDGGCSTSNYLNTTNDLISINDDDDNTTKLDKNISSDSVSTFEFIDYHSSDDEWNTNLKHEHEQEQEQRQYENLNNGQETKKSQQDDNDSKLEQDQAANDSKVDKNVSLLKKQKSTSSIKSTKDEKQRLNEELIILETTSSISSDTTGSWESFSMNRFTNNGNDKDLCKLFLINEIKYSVQWNNNDKNKLEKKGGCFIDASSLLDETEINEPHLPETGCFGPEPIKIVDEKFRQDHERRQGELLFKNSIHQFSGHIINPKIEARQEEDYFNVYTTCSEPNSIQNASSLSNELRLSDNLLFLPDTPNNSIVQIDEKILLSDGLEFKQRSLPKKSQKYNEESPIISGGSSFKDFPSINKCDSPLVKRRTENCPILSGGNLDVLPNEDDDDDVVMKKALDSKRNSSSTTSWIVDMSDCNNKNANKSPTPSTNSAMISTSSNKDNVGYFVSLNDLKIDENNKSTATGTPHNESVKKSTGFFIDFTKDNNNQKSINENNKPAKDEPVNDKEKENDKKPIFSMFIDFGEKKPLNTKKEITPVISRLSNSLNTEKGNCSNVPPISTNKLNNNDKLIKSTNIIHDESNYLNKIDEKVEIVDKQVKEADNGGAGLNNAIKNEIEKEQGDQAKKGFYMYIENDDKQVTSVPILRRLHSTNTAILKTDNSKQRHSWNTNNIAEKYDDISKHYKRSSSLSTDKGIMSILDKIPFISQTSSMSIDSSISPYDDFSCSKSSDISNTINTNSVSSQSSCNYDNNNVVKVSKRKRDNKINETFDKSSQGSITDGILSKDESPISSATETDDITYQNDITAKQVIINKNNEQTSSSNNFVMETIIENKEIIDFPPKEMPHTLESLQATVEKQKKLLESVSETIEPINKPISFVRLSDLDKKIILNDSDDHKQLKKNYNFMSNSAQIDKQIRNKLNSKIEEQIHSDSSTGTATTTTANDWTMSKSTGTNMHNLASSVENSRSLSRLFPHLSKVFTNSLPTDFGLINKSQIDSDFIQSDISYTSSVTSSRSGIDSADESSISCRQPRRLGEDLLKMFLQEIATDVILEVNGRKMRAHKCILRSRCQYFAAILAGGWLQNSGNIIKLPGYSYPAVHFALCHIYSGASHPPEGISLMELAGLADLLCLEGLKEVTAHALKINYCHNFHKPCSGCIDGTLQVLPVALTNGLDDLYRKCLKWVCKYFLKVWPTRIFAQLPPDIIYRCRQQIIAHLNSEIILSTLLDCDHLLTLLAPCKWGNTIENTVHEVLDSAQFYLSEHFSSLIASDGFLSLGHGQTWNISRLENILLHTASTLSPEQACKSYQRSTRLNKVLNSKIITIPSTEFYNNDTIKIINDATINNDDNNIDWSDDFIRLVGSIVSAVEQCLTRQCSRAMRTSAWQRMDVELRKKIQKLACLSDPIDDKRHRMNLNKFTYNHPVPTYQNRNQDLHQVRLVMQAHTKRVYDSQQYKSNTITNDRNTQTLQQTNDKCIQANNEWAFKVANKNENASVKKCTSRVNVPLTTHLTTGTVTKLQQTDDKKLSNHRRTLSETIKDNKIIKRTNDLNAFNTKSVPQQQQHLQINRNPRIVNVKPRYLETKRAKSVTQTGGGSGPTTLNKLKFISSSDSSRTTSPSLLNKHNLNNKAKTKSHTELQNISMDSLVSTTNNSLKNKSSSTSKATSATAGSTLVATTRANTGKNNMQLSIDSLGCCDESLSLHSSLNTNKTLSDESLVYNNKTKFLGKDKKQLNINNKINISKSTPIINNSNNMNSTNNKYVSNTSIKSISSTTSAKITASGVKNNIINKTKKSLTSCQNTNVNNSPLSLINNYKNTSSNSNTSLLNSPRDNFRNRISSSSSSTTTTAALVGTGAINGTGSLATKQKIQNGDKKFVAKSFLTQKSREILEKRSKLINLQKSATTNTVYKPTKSSNMKITTLCKNQQNDLQKNNNCNNSSGGGLKQKKLYNIPKYNGQQQQEQNYQYNNKKRIENNADDEDFISTTATTTDTEQEKSINFESKLERSSTFCKDSSDNPNYQLEIID